nr:MAG: ORF3 protein [Armillaria cepistipes negative-stranded RNA virus 1]
MSTIMRNGHQLPKNWKAKSDEDRAALKRQLKVVESVGVELAAHRTLARDVMNIADFAQEVAEFSKEYSGLPIGLAPLPDRRDTVADKMIATRVALYNLLHVHRCTLEAHGIEQSRAHEYNEALEKLMDFGEVDAGGPVSDRTSAQHQAALSAAYDMDRENPLPPTTEAVVSDREGVTTVSTFGGPVGSSSRDDAGSSGGSGLPADGALVRSLGRQYTN